jgi:hypothetical protein
MPRNIKIFLVLCALFALWRLYTNFAFALTPSHDWQSMLAQLSAAERQITRHGALIGAVMQTAYYLLPAAFFALVAGFTGRNWARWGFVAVLVLLEAFPLIYAGYTVLMRPELYHVIHHPIRDWMMSYQINGAHWTVWLRLAMKAVLIALLFTRNAEPWFHRQHRPVLPPVGAVHA